jgi:dipeptidyl aminopeptidase/acylaminoacyl peptidase
VAVGERGVYDWYSFVLSSDFNLFFVKHWFRDAPWKDPDDYRARSPITYVENMHTPLLIIHSEEDYRVPIDQGEELYTALKMLNRDVKMIRFPQESHELSRSGHPSHRVARIGYILDWVGAHLGH